MHRLIMCMTAAGLITTIPLQAAIDGAEIARSSAAMALRWENIKGAPYWISGPAPMRRAQGTQHGTLRGLHAVELVGDQSVAIHVPPQAMLRILVDEGGPLEAPVVSISDGTGLAVEHKPVPGADGRSWLVKTDAARPVVIHLHRAGLSATPQRLALFLGRFDAPREAATYRHELSLNGPRVNVRQANEATGRTHVRLKADQDFMLSVRGPDRLMLEYRADVAQAATTSVITMEAVLGEQPARLIRQVSGAESNMPIRIDGAWQTASRKERVALDIPPGEHQLRLRTSHDVLLRAAMEGNSDFLLPALNVPDAWRNAGPDTVLEEMEALEQDSIAVAMSNQWRDIGALASGKLQREASGKPEQRSLRTAADELEHAFTRFRDLLPDGPNEVNARSVVTQNAQSPGEAPRNQIASADSMYEPVPVALFHTIGNKAVRFALPDVPYPIRIRALVPRDASAARIDIEHDNGVSTTLMSGVQALDASALRPAAAGLGAVPKDAWPSSLSGHADRVGGLAPQIQVASTDWIVPAGARSMTLRTQEGSLPVALQWAGSAEYFLDDQFLAQLAHKRSASVAAAASQQAALLPLERMLAASHAQFVANVTPPPEDLPKVDAGKAQQALEAGQREAEPARAVALWQQAMRASDASVRAQALRGMANTLFGAGERFAAERMLRAYWISDDPALVSAAADELEALYAREDDRSMQTLFAAARAANDKSRLAHLSKALAADGTDGMALLAGLTAVERDMPALLQSALRSRKWLTFDALLEQLDGPQELAFWRAQRALSLGQLDVAERHFRDGGAETWSKALSDGHSISDRLLGAEGDKTTAMQSWLQWQAMHPGARLWQDEPALLVRHGGGVSMRSIALDLRSAWWRATSEQPLVARVAGPARIRVEARPLHRDAESRLGGWLRVKAADQLWLQPFKQNQSAPGLQLDTTDAYPGTSVVREIDLPPGLHELRIDAGTVPLVARVQVERPALQLPVLPAPVAAHFGSHASPEGRLVAGPACGFLGGGCQLVADGSLNAYRVVYDPVQWAGLPKPENEQDPVAARLAANDITGALEAATDPKERMRLLLWLAEQAPAERPRALAQGAALAKAHPEQEIRTHWNQLSAGSGWAVLPLVDRSAGLRRVEVAHGAPESMVARIRAAMLPALREGESRIGAGTRAALLLDARSPSSLVVEVAADNLPGDVSLPLQVTVERNGRQIHMAQLTSASGPVKIPVRVPAGEQHISVSLQQAYANQFLRVRFTGGAQPEPRVTRDWHIASRSQPVQATLSGPTWIRIDRLEGNAVHSEERLLTEPVSKLVLRPQPGAAETLYRIHQLRMHPVASNPAPARPSNYMPQSLPEAPLDWRGATGTETAHMPRQVRFVDAEPLAGQRESTLSARAALQSRRDSEATGGRTDTVLERFAEAGVTWRKTNEDQSRSHLADVFVRDREYGAPVIGFRLRTEQDVSWMAALPWPFTVGASLRGFAQNTPEGLGTSLTGSVAVSQTRVLAPTLAHRPTIEVTARAMNLSDVSDPRRVDTDVFSDYRNRHRRALTLSDTLSWRPRRDAHLAASISVTTNSDFDFGRVDNHRASAQWRQLVGPVIIEAGGSLTRYWADADRPRHIMRREVRIGASGDWWMERGTRIEVKGELRRDVDTSATWGGVELRWHWGPGRQLRDFAASELDFSAIRSWRAPTYPNRMEEE